MNTENWTQKFKTDLSLKYNSSRTIAMYSHNVLKFLKNFSQYREPKEIPTQKIKEYLLGFNTLNTRKQNLCALKRFYELTVNMPRKVSKIPYPKKTKHLPQVIDQEFVKRKISAIENLKHKAILSIAFSVGLRVSEVINLKIKDIDSDRMLIYIRNAKGSKDRIAPLSPEVLKLLRQYFKMYRPQVYLFNGQITSQYTASSCNKLVKKYLGVNYHFHTLRHSSFTAMLENNTDIRYIQQVAGHSSIKTTMCYTHITANALQNVNTPM